MAFPGMMDSLLMGLDLDSDTAAALMDYLSSGEASDAQIGAALTALRIKGVSAAELAAFARVMRNRANRVEIEIATLVDTCGTGGGAPSFNLSTGAAIVAAAAGATIAKHGNRAVTSKCGSADVLESMGIAIGEPHDLAEQLRRHRIAFLFAPAHHPAMRHLASARKSLGYRTVFNLLGPMLNPAGARRQLIGVYDARIAPPMLAALQELGSERVMIVNSRDGLDEISPVAPTDFVRIVEGRTESGTLEPSDFGLDSLDATAIEPGADTAANGQILLEALSDADSPRARALLPNAAAAIWLAGLADDLPTAAEIAHAAIRDGRSRALFDQLATGV